MPKEVEFKLSESMAFYLKQDKDMLLQECIYSDDRVSILKWVGTKLGFYKHKHNMMNDLEIQNLYFHI